MNTDSGTIIGSAVVGIAVAIITGILINLNRDKIKQYGVESAFAIL